MTKAEAIAAMQQGKKVTFKYFTGNEWMTINKNGHFEMEDGAACEQHIFWAYRTDPSWDEGWEIYE